MQVCRSTINFYLFFSSLPVFYYLTFLQTKVSTLPYLTGVSSDKQAAALLLLATLSAIIIWPYNST